MCNREVYSITHSVVLLCWHPLPIHWCCCFGIQYPFSGVVVLSSITHSLVVLLCCCVVIHYPFSGVVVLASITHSLVLLCWQAYGSFPCEISVLEIENDLDWDQLSPPSPPHPSPSTMTEQCSTTSKARGRMLDCRVRCWLCLG